MLFMMRKAERGTMKMRCLYPMLQYMYEFHIGQAIRYRQHGLVVSYCTISVCF
jgi:hypothetical protein